MKLGGNQPNHRAPRAVLAGVLALGLAACGKEPPPPPPAKATPPAAQPAAKAEPKADPAKEAAAKKAADAGQADVALAARVKAALGAAANLNAHRIDVVAKDGAVTLFGTADNRGQRDQATQIAARVEGVKSVENKLALVAGS